MSDESPPPSKRAGTAPTGEGTRGQTSPITHHSSLRYGVASAVGDPARHPNEDAWAADRERGVFAVCDGVTSSHLPDGTYPAWAGGARAAWLAAAAIVAAAPREGLA